MELIAEPKEAENTEILKIYKSLDQKIICHCYASFKIEEKNQKALVLLTEANMMFYFDSGENYITALPFEVLKIYAVEGGILMEQGEGKDFGRLFTLFHPNEQVKKVSVCDQAEEFDLGNVLLVRDEYIVTHTFDGISIYNIVINNSEFDLDMELDESGFSFEVEDQKSTLKLRLFSKLKVSVATSDVIWFLKDHTSTQILWILSREYQLLTGYSLKVAEVKERFKYTVHDACEFQCPLASGILALYPDGTTKMWIGYEDMIPCHINLAKLESKAKPKRSLSEPKDDSMIEIKSSKGVRVIGVETSPESGFVNLKLSDGTQTLARAKVIFHSNLITSLVDQIAYVVSPAEFVVFYSRLLFTTFGEINKTEHLNYWESFVVVFLSFLHDGLESSSVITKQDEADDFDWLIRNQKLNIFPECVTRNLKNETEPKSMGRLFNISVRVHRRFHHEPTLLPHISQLIIAFHLVYQDLLLDVSLKLQLDQLGDFMAQLLAGNQFQSYYLGLGYHSNSDSLPILAFNLDILDLPTITDWIYHLIATQLPQEHITTILTTLSDKDISSHKGLYLLKNISTLYTILFQKGPHSMILHFVDSECLANIDHLPVAIALTLRQAIHNCRNHPQSLAGNEAACRMIGRKDLAKNATDSIHFDKEERKKIVDLRFGKDDRVLQVTELLNPIADAVIEVPLKANMSIEEVSAAQQAALSQWALRPFAFALGNALFNFESSVIVPTEVFLIPKLKKSARLSPMKALIELASTPQNDVFVDWPEFHTGVAAALQIRADCQDVNSSWIVFNQIKSAEGTKVDTSHAGFIYGLGLLGHLKKLDSSDSLRNYFLPQHEILSVGHLLGLAAAHIGSRHPQITNMLSVHLPSMLPNQSIELNTGFVLKTGAIIGYGLLHFNHPSQYKFDKVFSEIDQVQITENSVENSGNGSYLIGCGFSLGFIGLGSVNKFKSSEQLVEKLILKLKDSRSSSEGISLAVALGLLCLRSNRKMAADALAVPNNGFLLDWFPPEVLMVRVICRCLILWDSIEPTRTWMQSQIPNFLLQSVKDNPLNLSPNNEHLVHSYYSTIGGLCFAIGLKYASTGDMGAVKLIEGCFDEIAPLCNLKCKLQNFILAKQFSYAEKLFAGIARNALNATMSALCMVLAGSGSIHHFQKLKTIHEKTSLDLLYGSHIAASMSIGLLFLASGSATIGSSNKAIATLLCSFFPLYPSSPTDNRYHLQALRHLWVLAVERRCVITRDVDTGNIVTVPIEIQVLDTVSAPDSQFSPTILPPLDWITTIKISGPRYWELELEFDNLREQDRNLTIWVQRKSQYLSYSDDPDGKRGISASSPPKMTNTSSEKDQDKFLKKRERFIHSFSSYPEVLTFVRYLCLTEFGDDNNSKLAEFCVQILHECLSHDKLEMVSAYVTIFRDLTRILSGNSPTSFDAISMKIVIEFVRQCDLAGQKCVLDDTFVDRLQHNITENWAAKLQELVPLFAKHYLQNGSLPAGLTVNQFQVAIAYLEYFAWPKPRDLALLQQKSDLIQSDAILKSAFHLKQYFPLISVSALRKILEIIVS